MNKPFVVYHGYENERYDYKLNPDDPIRQIRTDQGGTPQLYSSLGAEGKNKKGETVVTNAWFNMPDTFNIANMQFIVNSKHQIVLMPLSGGVPAATNNGFAGGGANVGATIISGPNDSIRVVALEASLLIDDALS